MMQTITIRLPQSQKTTLKKIARDNDLSVSALARMSLEKISHLKIPTTAYDNHSEELIKIAEMPTLSKTPALDSQNYKEFLYGKYSKWAK